MGESLGTPITRITSDRHKVDVHVGGEGGGGYPTTNLCVINHRASF